MIIVTGTFPTTLPKKPCERLLYTASASDLGWALSTSHVCNWPDTFSYNGETYRTMQSSWTGYQQLNRISYTCGTKWFDVWNGMPEFDDTPDYDEWYDARD
jgi:hypothetical protein